MPIELTESSTHEDIQAAVDQAIKQQQGEPEKSDAQAIAEERDKPVVPETAETDSGSEDTADVGEEAGPQEWLDDTLKAEVAAYGISEEELADFTSREELERALRFTTRKALDIGRKALEGEPVRDEQGRFMKKESEPEVKEAPADEGQYEVTLSDFWDEDCKTDLQREFARLHDRYESRLASLEERFQETAARAEEQRFDAAIDSLGYPALFGRTGSENEKQLKCRVAVHEALAAQMQTLRDQGREGDYDFWVGVLAKGLFADDFTKKELKARTKKVSKQSNSRTGDGSTKGADPVESLRDEMRRRYKELEDAGSA